MRETAVFPLPVKNLTSPWCSSTPISYMTRKFGDSRTFKVDIGLLNICMGFQDLLA